MVRRCSSIYLLTVFSCCFSLPVLAADGRNIARCFDANGDITYSDVLCTTFENDNPHMMSEDAVQRHIRNRQISAIEKASTISPTELSSATDEAIARCQQNFPRYFKRKYRSLSDIPAIEFNQLVDQYSKGSKISISALGSVEYDDSSASRTIKVECTAQKMRADAGWQVGYREK